MTSIINRLLHEREEQRENEAGLLYNNFERPDLQLQQATSLLNPTPVASYLNNNMALTRAYNIGERPVWVARDNRGW